MTESRFKRLKIGDHVKLVVMRPDYTCGHSTIDGKIYISAGAQGIIGAVKVPSVRGKNGIARYFVCVDFPNDTPLTDCKGVAAKHWDGKSGYRCACYPEELE